MMESIEKLREWARGVTNSNPDENIVSPEFVAHECGRKVLLIADAIEREIAERYMELPLDADGVPIHVGDEMESDNERFVVCAVAPGRVHRWHVHNIGELDKGTVAYPPDSLHHYKPRTLEDVLASYRFDAQNIYEDSRLNGNQRVDELEALDSKVAAEIRELMGVDE